MNNLEKTLSIIKPDAVERNLQEEIKKNFIDNGFDIKNEKKIQISARPEFDLSLISDGIFNGTQIRTLQAHYGISLCGPTFKAETHEVCERKYQKAIRITERIAAMGSSNRDNLPYFNAAEHLTTLTTQ